MAKKKTRTFSDPEAESAGTSLGDLLRAQGLAPSPAPAAAEPTRAAAGPAEGTPDTPDWRAIKKLVIRRERKGRKGKTVTLVSGLPAGRDGRRDVARALGRALGCGATLEGDDVLLQGDQIDRARRWLEGRGVRRVVKSGG